MEANNRNLYKKIIEQTYRQYTIPVYQRLYSWEKDQCNQLYDDIINCVIKDKSHYLGSLVYKEQSQISRGTATENEIESEPEDEFTFCSIIDGQQRLTTVILLLKALYDLMDDANYQTIKNRIHDSLYNSNCEERYKLKLKSIESDNQELEKVLMGNTSDLNPSSNVAINYNNFISRIKKSVSDGISLKDIFKGIQKLEVVEIILDENDNPQLIFESINSTGKYLETSDLIRNFLLMGFTDPGLQKEYHTKYWIKLQNDIGIKNIESFFYDFLVMKDTKYIEEKKVYENFKQYYRDVDDYNKVFEEIVRYGEYYKLIVCNDSKLYSSESNELCKMFGLLRHNTIFQFLLRVCDDFKDVQLLYRNDVIVDDRELLISREKEFNNILKLFGNYALRRSIAEIPSSSLRRFYAALYNKVFGINNKNHNNYYKALEAYLCTLRTNDRMPSDGIFNESLLYNNIYKKPKILRFLFNLIENPSTSKEKAMMSETSIEHILPETLSNQWKTELGEDKYQMIYDKYVHTLGNLSITGYNSEYSNKPFLEKKKIFNQLLADGEVKITKLNEELIGDSVQEWGEDQIVNRANRLISKIIVTYPYPEEIDTTIEFEKYYEYYLDDEDDEAGEYIDNPIYQLYGFKFDGLKYRCRYFKDIYIEYIKILYSMNPSILDKLAKEHFTLEGGSRVHFSNERISDRLVEISPTLFIETNYSRKRIFWWIKELAREYQLDLHDFCILFTDSEE